MMPLIAWVCGGAGNLAASPYAYTLPAVSTSQYPLPSAVAAMPVIDDLLAAPPAGDP